MFAEFRVPVKLLSKLCLVKFLFVIIHSCHVLATQPNNEVHNAKYVLRWSGKNIAPFQFLKQGNTAFIEKKCKYTNCYVTDDRTFISLTDFDAILFNGRSVIYMNSSQLPQSRSSKQKYIFTGTESPHRFPACNEALDNFFNWTWTYKLSSSIRFAYITIYNLQGNVVGPAINMTWPENMEPIGDDIKRKLSKKSKAAAIFVSNCRSKSKRDKVTEALDRELRQLGWNVDIYGRCGFLECPRTQWRVCNKKLQEDYYFYLAFENSFSEDYVTEKLLLALENYAVPVVLGSANYSRFLPSGSYLDATRTDAKSLAHIMDDLITNKEKYYDFFRWRNYFTYKHTLITDGICNLCEALNNDDMVNTESVWPNFRRWWNGETYEETCPNAN